MHVLPKAECLKETLFTSLGHASEVIVIPSTSSHKNEARHFLYEMENFFVVENI